MKSSDSDTQPIRPPSGWKDNEFVCADCEEPFNPINPPGQTSNRFCPRCVLKHYPPEVKSFAELAEEDGIFSPPRY